jgi:hypothetical protein
MNLLIEELASRQKRLDMAELEESLMGPLGQMQTCGLCWMNVFRLDDY